MTIYAAPVPRRRPRPSLLMVTLLLIVAPVLAACTESGPRELGAPSGSEPPSGSRAVTCELTADNGPLTFSFVLEDAYAPAPEATGSGCAWARPAPPRVEEPQGNPTGDPAVESVVVAEWIGAAESLREVRDRQQPYVSEDGDDALSDLRLSEDVPVFGETVGDRLRWDCFCDGVPQATYLSQAAGVRLTWNGSAILQDQIEDEVRTALASAGAG